MENKERLEKQMCWKIANELKGLVSPDDISTFTYEMCFLRRIGPESPYLRGFSAYAHIPNDDRTTPSLNISTEKITRIFPSDRFLTATDLSSAYSP